MDSKCFFVRRGRVFWIRGIVLLAAVLFIAYGISRGEAQVVYKKAVNICLECIGIG